MYLWYNCYGEKMKKALIIYGSPSLKGNTNALTNVFKENFNGQVSQINLFSTMQNEGIAPCNGCNGCNSKKGCVKNDEFDKILKDDYDVLVIACPIYMSNMPGPFWNLMSRFNFTFNNKVHLKQTISFKAKKGVLILVGGGSECKSLMGASNEDNPIRQAKYVCKKLNVDLENNIFLSLNTDKVPAINDVDVVERIKESAKRLSQQSESQNHM